MKPDLVRIAVAAALAGAAMQSHAAIVYYSDWAYGNSWNNTVNVSAPNHNGAAGGFKGSVDFSAAEEALGFKDILNDKFISYCVEITESFSGFPSAHMSAYDVVSASAYSAWGTTKANRLGQLVSYAKSNASLVDTAGESTSLQLAIWNVIYESGADNSITTGGFKETSSSRFDGYADKLLTDSHAWQNTYDLYVLTKSGSQDFLLLRERGSGSTTGVGTVPEPSSLALVFAAFGALGLASRRRPKA